MLFLDSQHCRPQKETIKNGQTNITIRSISCGYDTVKFDFFQIVSIKFFHHFFNFRLTRDFSEFCEIILMMFCSYLLIAICSQLVVIEIKMAIYEFILISIPKLCFVSLLNLQFSSPPKASRNKCYSNRDNNFVRSNDWNNCNTI